MAGVVALVCLAGTAQAQISDPEDEIVEEFSDEVDELTDLTKDIIESLNSELDQAIFDFSACNVLLKTPKGSVKCIIEYVKSATKVQTKRSRACKNYGRGVTKSLLEAQRAARDEGVLEEFNDDPRVSDELHNAATFLGICVSGNEKELQAPYSARAFPF